MCFKVNENEDTLGSAYGSYGAAPAYAAPAPGKNKSDFFV